MNNRAGRGGVSEQARSVLQSQGLTVNNANNPITSVFTPTVRPLTPSNNNAESARANASAPGSSNAQAPGSSNAQSPGSSNAQSPGSSNAQAPGNANARAPGSSNAQAPGSSAQAPGRSQVCLVAMCAATRQLQGANMYMS